MGRSEGINELLDSGFNCAESMVVAFADMVDLPRDIGMRAATGFGGGMGRTGNVCGLVSGAVLILGWSVGRNDPADLQSKKRAYDVVARLIRSVESSRRSILCPGILGADLADGKSQTCVAQSEEFKKRCRLVAAEVAETLEQLLVPSSS